MQSFLGIVNYLGHFISKIASLTGSLKKAMCSRLKKHHAIAFNVFVNELSSDKLLRNYESVRKLFLECDASDLGAGFTLLQNFSAESDDHEVDPKYLSELLPIAYGSHTFSECE